ncbi:DUF6320 domain-containing protein [Natribacillus halophilus]|uniref:Zinc ribbon domain-containing protein n=1 Tax=Natribacillus halophilus TaxID=549003 RepID=A0A1G8LCE8_9BACI|nr:DUF6320 domain-containing protein [Natribacillus halophilus]SDI53293.1 hypothetical protein SAMN04488123_10319 [Natribacillus halophilus]
MHRCSNCSVWTAHQYCPLCKRQLTAEKTALETYPPYHSDAKRRNLKQRVFLFIAILIISSSLLINLLTTPDQLWVFYIVGPVLYALLFINHTILSKAHAGSKIIFQVLALSAMLVVIDVTAGATRWSVHYVIPFLVILATLTVTIIILRKPMKWREYLGYMMTMIILGFLPVLLFLSALSYVLWPGAATALYALLTFIGMVLFANKTMKNEIVRRFHF